MWLRKSGWLAFGARFEVRRLNHEWGVITTTGCVRCIRLWTGGGRGIRIPSVWRNFPFPSRFTTCPRSPQTPTKYTEHFVSTGIRTVQYLTFVLLTRDLRLGISTRKPVAVFRLVFVDVPRSTNKLWASILNKPQHLLGSVVQNNLLFIALYPVQLTKRPQISQIRTALMECG
jgi:hypothetical protein